MVNSKTVLAVRKIPEIYPGEQVYAEGEVDLTGTNPLTLNMLDLFGISKVTGAGASIKSAISPDVPGVVTLEFNGIDQFLHIYMWEVNNSAPPAMIPSPCLNTVSYVVKGEG